MLSSIDRHSTLCLYFSFSVRSFNIDSIFFFKTKSRVIEEIETILPLENKELESRVFCWYDSVPVKESMGSLVFY